MSNFLRLALEENGVEAAEGGLEDGSEYTLARMSHEMDNRFEDTQAVAVVMESLSGYVMRIESLIEKGKCTPETLSILRLGVEQQLNRLHHPRLSCGLENHSDDIVRQHELVMEEARDATLAWQQTQVVSWKETVNSIGDFFRSTDSQVQKYRDKLEETKEELTHKKNDWNDVQHRTSLVELWYHFSTERGPAVDIPSAVHKDLELSTYILTEYTSAVAKELSRLSSMLKSARMDKVDDAIKLFSDIARMKTGATLFKSSYLGGFPYLSATGLSQKKGDRRQVIEVKGKEFGALATLATPDTIVESVSRYHEKQMSSAKWKGNFDRVKFLEADKMVKLTAAQIGELIEDGFKYLDNVTAYRQNTQQFIGAVNSAMESVTKLLQGASDKLDGKDKSAVAHGLKQVEQYLQNLVHCYQNPAEAEIARSIKGAKYLLYLTLRMIHNAK